MIRWLLLSVALLALAACVLGWLAYRHVNERAHAGLAVAEPGHLIVEPGDTVNDVIRALTIRGALRENWWARAYVRIGQVGHIQAGEFDLIPGDSLVDVLDRLARGRVTQHQWTVVPGWTVRDMLASLDATYTSRTPGLSVDGLPLQLKLPTQHAEGWFLPDTYSYVRGERDLSLLGRAHQAMQQALEQHWQDRQPELPLDTPYDLLIAGSLVEKETGHPDDRAFIASVFARRLQIGMRLQTDPTVIYGIGEGFDGNLTRKHLRTPTPYNTYTNHGLPPTPIALPGHDALHAAAHPAESDYLYFVARGDGTSQFSRTLEEHQAAVRRYQLGR